MCGPGTEFKKLIPKVMQHAGCGCNDYARKMDRWGPDLCEKRFYEIVAHLVNKAKSSRVLKMLPEGITKHQAEKWLAEAIRRSR